MNWTVKQNWTVGWNWTSGPPVLRNKVACNKSRQQEEEIAEFEEVKRQIEEEILTRTTEDAITGVLPLMAAVMPTENKVRPVLDDRVMSLG